MADGGSASGTRFGKAPGGLPVLGHFWALRQRLADGDTPSPAFLCGFRLAFGLARLEPALAAFECLFGELAAHGRDVTDRRRHSRQAVRSSIGQPGRGCRGLPPDGDRYRPPAAHRS